MLSIYALNLSGFSDVSGEVGLITVILKLIKSFLLSILLDIRKEDLFIELLS
jgi:hypothetical protein